MLCHSISVCLALVAIAKQFSKVVVPVVPYMSLICTILHLFKLAFW